MNVLVDALKDIQLGKLLELFIVAVYVILSLSPSVKAFTVFVPSWP